MIGIIAGIAAAAGEVFLRTSDSGKQFLFSLATIKTAVRVPCSIVVGAKGRGGKVGAIV